MSEGLKKRINALLTDSLNSKVHNNVVEKGIKKIAEDFRITVREVRRALIERTAELIGE